MAKKKGTVRRTVRPEARPAAPQAVAERMPVSEAAPAPRPLPRVSPRPGIRPQDARSRVPLAEEYHYVITDLKRLGMLAAGTAVVLLALGMIIR